MTVSLQVLLTVISSQHRLFGMLYLKTAKIWIKKLLKSIFNFEFIFLASVHSKNVCLFRAFPFWVFLLHVG